jgi:uncharacterized protein YegP (UPF0339 family)
MTTSSATTEDENGKLQFRLWARNGELVSAGQGDS